MTAEENENDPNNLQQKYLNQVKEDNAEIATMERSMNQLQDELNNNKKQLEQVEQVNDFTTISKMLKLSSPFINKWQSIISSRLQVYTYKRTYRNRILLHEGILLNQSYFQLYFASVILISVYFKGKSSFKWTENIPMTYCSQKP